MAFKIEKNIALPEVRRNSPPPPVREPKYPFAKMEVGDSFAIKKTKMEAKRRKQEDGKLSPPRVAAAAYQYGRKHNMKFQYRILEDESVRVWRVE